MRIVPQTLVHAGPPLVTIAVPTFNRAELLDRCLRTALAQVYSNFEVLVSDNASTDDTPKVLERFDDRRLRVTRQRSNIGLLPNWNACLAQARGEYIVYISDDDTVSPYLLERCIGTLGGRTDIPVIVALSNLHLAALARTRSARRSRILGTGIHDGRAILSEFLNDQITVACCSVVMNTDLLRQGGGFPLHLAYTADVAAWVPLLLRGDAGFVNEACATGLIHDASETARHSIELRLDDARKATAIIAKEVDEQKAADRSRQKLLQQQLHSCFARRNLTVLSDHRSKGASVREVIRLAWQFRSDLWAAGLIAMFRSAAIVLCPYALAARLRLWRLGSPGRVRNPELQC